MLVVAYELCKYDFICIDDMVYNILGIVMGKRQKHGFRKITFTLVNLVTDEQVSYTCSSVANIEKMDYSITKRAIFL